MIAQPVHARLNAALAGCDYPPLRDQRSFRKLGAGAWHDAFRVVTADGQRRVVRLRKATIYGRPEPYDETALRSDYAGVGVYYAAANTCRPGICPAGYRYAISAMLSCTVESYLGPTLSLGHINLDQAFAIGRDIGDAFRALHACPAPCDGWGELIWTPDGVRGEETAPRAEIEGAEQAALRGGFARLVADRFIDQPALIERKLDAALARREAHRDAPALVNSDITPENIIVRRGRFAGLIDPVPRIGSPLRYAAFFLLCYRLYLPALHDAPRYARHRYNHFAPNMACIADGYLTGYVKNDAALVSNLEAEYWLWVLELAIEAQAALAKPMTEERRIRTGGYAPIARRLREYVRRLTTIALSS